MKGIGELGILESKKEALKTPEIGVDSPEALKAYGKEMQGKVDKDAEIVKKDTNTELNEVVLDYTSSTNMPESEISELLNKHGVHNRIHESFGKVDRAAEFAKDKIGQVAQLVTSKELSQIADATPFVGGAKRVIESVAGKTLSGENLSGKDRLKRGASGAIDLGLDAVAVGAVKKGARLAYVSKKIVEGIKQNPEVIANLGKKIVQNSESTAQGSKDISLVETSDNNSRKSSKEKSGDSLVEV